MFLSESFMSGLATTIREGAPFPKFPEGLSLEDAYQSLTTVATMACRESTAGIKAGLTDPKIQKFFGLNDPLLGYLYDWGERQAGDTIARHDKGQIECEIGIVLDEIGRPTFLAPAIEFVRVDFSNSSDFTPANLVLTSLGADQFILGQQVEWEDELASALGELEITLSLNEAELLNTTAGASLGGPKNAVDWCVRETKKRGIRY